MSVIAAAAHRPLVTAAAGPGRPCRAFGGLQRPAASLQAWRLQSQQRHGSSRLLAPPAGTPLLLRRRPCRRRAAAPPPPRAALWSLPPDLASSLQTGCGIAWLLAIGFSALPILTGEAAERNERRFLRPDEEDSTENVRWTVMGVLSVIPFVNPMAWVFAALDDADSSALYYTYALLYALPYLGNGLQLDGWAALSVAVCAAHVQVERVAQTEPAEVELPSVLRRLAAALPRALGSLGRAAGELGSEAGARARSAEAARRRRPDRKYLEERSREARAELEEFDRRRRERQAEQQRLWRQQEEAEEAEGRRGGRK